jgi:hypothetical protein
LCRPPANLFDTFIARIQRGPVQWNLIVTALGSRVIAPMTLRFPGLVLVSISTWAR